MALSFMRESRLLQISIGMPNIVTYSGYSKFGFLYTLHNES